jgi:hypothetical protein
MTIKSYAQFAMTFGPVTLPKGDEFATAEEKEAGHNSTIDLTDDEFAQVQADEEFCDMVRDGKYVVE